MKTISRYIMTLALLITAATGAWAQDTYTVAGNNSDMFGSVWDPTYTANDMTKNGDGTYSITYTNVYLEDNVLYKVVKNHSWDEAYPAADRVITIAEAGTYTLTIHFNPTTHEVYETMPGSGSGEPDVEVTTNAASEGATFTEASFQMPTNDVTVDYELVRDMSVQMTTTMGDGTDGLRYRVKKAQQGEGYEPADLNMMQVLALVAVNDGIEQKALTLNQDYFCRIYKLDEQTLQPEGDGVTLTDFDFAPGLYALKAFAQDDSDYAGETALSNTFKLFQGYEVEVAAKEFITYYKDEPLYVEDEAAELYTIQSVNDTQAVLSQKCDAMPSNTPMLVYNNSDVTKVILLIPCNEPDMAITVAPEFQGTLTGGEIPASSAVTDYYALNGKAFVWVKYAIEIGANKCWLQIGNQPASTRANTRSIVGGGNTTGIDAIENVTIDNEGWYDLQGRKLQSAPNRKGIYIHNGRKVVVH